MVHFCRGSGVSRVWVIATTVDHDGTNVIAVPDALAKIVVPENFSGAVGFQARTVVTENDGDSLTGPWETLSFTIIPSVDSTLTDSTTIPEDRLEQVDFSIVAQNGEAVAPDEGGEYRGEIRIKSADVLNKYFTLYYGNNTSETLDQAANDSDNPLVAKDGDYYVLTGSARDNIYAMNKADLHGSYTFEVQYVIVDPSNETGTGNDSGDDTVQKTQEYTLNFTAVTDPIDEDYHDEISLTNIANGLVDGTTVTVRDNGTINVNLAISQVDQAEGPDTTPNGLDIDSSETRERFIIDNVPDGVSVVGGTYTGNGRWILDAVVDFGPFKNPVLETIQFSVEGDATALEGLGQDISIRAESRDDGSFVTQDTVVWTLVVPEDGTFDQDSGLPVEPVPGITTWSEDANFPPTEDTPISLSDLLSVTIDGSGKFSVTLTDVADGVVISGMTEVVEDDGSIYYTLSGSGDSAAVETLMADVSVTAPPNENSNNATPPSKLFDARLTTYGEGNVDQTQVIAVEPPVTPVTDPTTVIIDGADVLEDADTVDFTVRFENSADTTFTTMPEGTLTLTLDESGMDDSGAPLVFNGEQGRFTDNFDGTYTITGVTPTETLSFRYVNDMHASGPLNVTASIKTQELNAAKQLTSEGTASFAITPVPDGFVIGTITARGYEDNEIPFVFSGKDGLVDEDGSESVTAVLLKNVPVGYLVKAGADAGSAALVSNLGGDGTPDSPNTWKIPVVGDDLPAYIAVVPPEDVAETLDNLSLEVWTSDNGVEHVDTQSFDLEVTPVADSVDPNLFTPTKSFGQTGIPVPLNLNLMLEDMDGSETVTLRFQGIGDDPVTFVDAEGKNISDYSGVTAVYDDLSDTWTLTALPGYDESGVFDVNNLSILSDTPIDNSTITVTAQTVERSNGNISSESAQETFVLDIDPFPTDGDDIYLYDGTSPYVFDGGDGEDMVRLEDGVDLNSSDIAKFDNIEMLDLGPYGDHSATLSPQDVLDITDGENRLYIDADSSGDQVNGSSGSDWNRAVVMDQTISGTEYHAYTGTVLTAGGPETVTLYVDNEATISL